MQSEWKAVQKPNTLALKLEHTIKELAGPMRQGKQLSAIDLSDEEAAEGAGVRSSLAKGRSGDVTLKHDPTYVDSRKLQLAIPGHSLTVSVRRPNLSMSDKSMCETPPPRVCHHRSHGALNQRSPISFHSKAGLSKESAFLLLRNF